MGRHLRIRRTLAIRVTEPRVDMPEDDLSPGQRFATGWGHFQRHGAIGGGMAQCEGDPIQIAGFLAAKAAWEAHHYAVNWIEIRSTNSGKGMGRRP